MIHMLIVKVIHVTKILEIYLRRNEMPHNPYYFVKFFMGLFPYSFGFVYILLACDYVSKWVDA